MADAARQPSALTLGLGVAMVALWPSCGGKSVSYEDEPDDMPGAGGSGVGADGGGGVAGTPSGGVNGFGGSSVPRGGSAPNGGDGIGAAPVGGSVGVGGVGIAGVGVAGMGFGGSSVAGTGFSGAAGFTAGTSSFGGFGGSLAGAGGRAMGRGMGGRFGMGGRGFGGRGPGGFGGRGPGGFGGGGGFGSNPLDGFIYRIPCDAAPVNGPFCEEPFACLTGDPSLPGFHPTDQTVVMPGASGIFYDLTIHFQGLVDSKAYTGGTDQDGYATVLDGMYTQGFPVVDTGTIYLLRVTSPARDYFLNSLLPPMSVPPGQPFVVNYRAIVRVEGGTSVRLVSADADCDILRNCGPIASTMLCNPVTVENLAPVIAVNIGTQPFNGQFIGLAVESVATVP